MRNNIETFQNQDIVLFTSTFYQQDAESINRSKLAIDLVRNAYSLGVKLIIADASPLSPGENTSQFEKDLRHIIWDNSTISIIRTQKRLDGGTTSTMADERKQSLEHALFLYPKNNHFLWIEPEKANLITAASLSKIIQTAKETGADFVIPARAQLSYILNQDNKKVPDISVWGMNTLPEFQARTETRANKALRKDMWESHDSYFWPVLLKRWTWTEQWLQSPHPQWGINVLTPIEGKKKWLSVATTPVDYHYDNRQKMFENGEIDAEGDALPLEKQKSQAKKYKRKRVEQYMQIVYNQK
jgi:hypothetical protein